MIATAKTNLSLIGCSVWLLLVPSWCVAQERNPGIARGATEFARIYQRSGIVGLNTAIEECWRKFKAKPKLADAEFCFGLDYITSVHDKAFTKNLGAPDLQSDATKIEKVQSRVDGTLETLNLSQDAKRDTLTKWSSAADRAYAKWAK